MGAIHRSESLDSPSSAPGGDVPASGSILAAENGAACLDGPLHAQDLLFLSGIGDGEHSVENSLILARLAAMRTAIRIVE